MDRAPREKFASVLFRLMWVRALVIPVILVTLCGCVFPVRTGDPDPFPEHKFDFIEVGVSTKDDIANTMSEFPIETREGEEVTNFQPMKFYDGAWWLYAAERSEANWLLIDPWSLYPAITGSEDYRYLLIKFDDEGIVRDYQLSRSKEGRCNDSGVCASGPAYGLLDPDGKIPFQPVPPAPQRCRVYLYGRNLYTGIPILLDDDAQGWLLTTKTHISLELDPGGHRVESRTPYECELVPWGFDCHPGEIVYIHLDPEHVGLWDDDIRTRFVEESEKRALKRLRKSLPMLIPSEIPDLVRPAGC